MNVYKTDKSDDKIGTKNKEKILKTNNGLV